MNKQLNVGDTLYFHLFGDTSCAGTGIFKGFGEEEMMIIELSNDLSPYPAKTRILVKEGEIVE